MKFPRPIVVLGLILLPGCATAPRLVKLVDQQPLDIRADPPASFVAPAEGTVGIFDLTQNRPLFRATMSAGQSITIDRPFQRVIIETQAVTPVAMPPNDQLQVVFKESK